MILIREFMVHMMMGPLVKETLRQDLERRMGVAVGQPLQDRLEEGSPFGAGSHRE